MHEALTSKKTLSVFRLVMMAVVAIDSLKNLPANAQYGTSLLFFYFAAVLTFFIPSALVSAELATSLPQTGGVYVWVREAFGKHFGFLTVWVQWMVVVTWYPTILSFIAVTLVYLFSPELATNKFYVLSVILTSFWLAVFLISKGIKMSSQISTFCAIVGVISPTIFIVGLGIYWVFSGKPSQLHFASAWHAKQLFTNDNLRLSITLLYSLMGMEMIAVHAGDVKDPQKQYPRALIIAAIIIICTIIPASLAIALVIPTNQISLTSGVNDAFIMLLNACHLGWLKPVIIIAIAIGSFGIFYNWFLSPARCLLIAANDSNFPQFLQKSNKNDMPVTQMMIQGVIFSFMSIAFLFMPSVNSAFWLLTAACAQLGLIYYLFVFAAALRLRYTQPNLVRPFRVGKHPITMWITCVTPFIVCCVAIGFGFLPPPEIDSHHLFSYEFFLTTLMIGSCVAGSAFYFAYNRKPKKMEENLNCEQNLIRAVDIP